MTTASIRETAGTARKYWWIMLIRGILAIALGVMMIAWPEATVKVAIFLFGLYFILDGIASITMGIMSGRAGEKWGWLVFVGVLDIGAGIVAFVWPGATALVLLYLIAFWSILAGGMAIFGSFSLKSAGARDWGWVLFGGIVSLIFGIILLIAPGHGILGLIWLVAIWAIVFGIVLIVNSFIVRSVSGTILDATGGPTVTA